MMEPLRIADSAPLGGFSDRLSGVQLTLLSTLDPDRLEAALTVSLLQQFRGDACLLLRDEEGSDFRRQLSRAAQSRSEAIAVETPSPALCAPLTAPASLIVERQSPFTREELRHLASLAPFVVLALRNAQLFMKATTDELTALPNRQRFVVELEVGVSSGGPLSLILVDLDHFKDKSEVYGATVGDRALAELGGLLRSLPVLAAARSGDDEFALLLKAAAGPARDLAEELRKTVNDSVFDEQHEGIHLTLSCGVAELRSGEMASALFARAAEALATAKRRGRDRVEVAK